VWRKEDGSPQSTPEVSPGSMNAKTPPRGGTTSLGGSAVSPHAAACVSQGIKIKGEIAGSEDLFIDGVVDGKISLTSATLTIGPNAKVNADIAARDLILRGRAEGKFVASAKIEIWTGARVRAELKSERISIEDGAELRGTVEAGSAAAAAPAKGTVGQGKKHDAGKTTGQSTTDEKTPSGAAAAGTD
jgi:cytoskeletal protein CcmA (bactofilin family)